MYDGLTSATVVYGDNRIAGDTLTVSGTAAFLDKNVGMGKTVNVSGISLAGADAGNYTYNTTASTTADITPASLTITATGINKVYDGLTSATVTLGDNRVSGDTLSLSYTTAAFLDKNVGTGKTVNVSGITVGGADAGNYSLQYHGKYHGGHHTCDLTITATGINKVYDRLRDATVTLGDNRISGDTLSLSYTAASFADKNVANGKTVYVSGISLTGADSGNYTYNITASTTADITPASLTITATGINKVYDGLTSATVV